MYICASGHQKYAQCCHKPAELRQTDAGYCAELEGDLPYYHDTIEIANPSIKRRHVKAVPLCMEDAGNSMSKVSET